MTEIDYGKMAKCHEYNEELIAKVYFKAAEKVTDPVIKGIFLFIAYDSEKHAQVFKELAEEYGVADFNSEECSMYSGAAYGMRGLLMETLEKIENAKTMDEVIDIVEHLESIESMLTELDRAVILKGLRDECKKKLYEKILEYVEEDEHRHEDIIRGIYNNYKK